MTTKNTDILAIEVKKHLDADLLVKGQYWENGRGCFIACLAHSDDPKVLLEKYGFPVPLTRLCEGIHEAIPIEEGRKFFGQMPDAVAYDGKDLSLVVWKFLAAELRALPAVPDEVQAVIDPVIAGMDLLASGGEWSDAARAAAAYAAYAAAYVAEAAAYAASADADARTATAAYAAAVTHAALAAADADVDAYAARIRQRDTLVRLISEAK